MKHLPLLAAFAAALLPLEAFSAWELKDGDNPDASGRRVEITQDGTLVARFIYGEGQIKPYLQLFGEQGDSLNEWGKEQQYPHHRGFYIGWNKVSYEVNGKRSTVDLWHLNKSGSLSVKKLEALEGTANSAKLVATVEWRGNTKDGAEDALLITEKRTLVISKPAAKQIQVDANFALHAKRQVNLGGDLQHAGIHFRGSKELLQRTKETKYVWEPNVPGKGGKVESTDLKWARLLFPIGERWYTATLMNSPKNPVEQLSWRDYGRFGFFFTRDLKADETLALDYRLVVENVPAASGKPGEIDEEKLRKGAQELYSGWVK